MTDTARLSTALGDRYRIERELGAGGMATVYLAHDVRHQREVALKVLRPELTAVLGAERFLNEVRITARLDHPHILTLIDSGESEGFLWYVLPYVRGESLRVKLEREKQLGMEEALQITRQVASALEHAHRHGVVHRDIKPENILLFEGEAMLADFGIALAVKEAGGNRLTETGLSLGTPQYMSPEQATGDRQLDARSDVYSLGAVLYEMLAGEPPVTGPTAQAMIAKLMTERPTRLRVVRDTVPEGIETAVAKALAKTPADRFSGTAEFADALARASLPVQPQRGMPRWALGLAAAAVLLVLAGAGWLALSRGSPDTAFTPQLEQLTTDGNARGAALSPDGSRLALITRDCDSLERCTERLVVRDTGGAGSITVMTGSAIGGAGWATGGRFLVVQRTDSAGRLGMYAVPALGGAPRFLGCCNGGVVGVSDTMLLGPFLLTAADSVVWLRFLTVSDGLVRDSIPVRRPGLASIGNPAPAGGKVAVASLTIPTWTIRMLDRAGRVTDSMSLGSSFNGVFWAPLGDALLWPMPAGIGAQVSGAPSSTVVLRRRIGADGRFTGNTDTLLLLPPGSQLGEINPDGTALLRQGPVDGVVYALERPRAGRLEFRSRRLAASTAGLQASLSRDGEAVWLLRRSAEGTGGGRRDAIIPFEGGQERPFTVPLGEVSGWDWTRLVSSNLLLDVRDSTGRRIVEVAVATGQVREVARPSEESDFWFSIPGGGYAEVDLEGGTARLRGRPGASDTTLSARQVPGRIVFPGDLSPDGRSFLEVGLNSSLDTNWLRVVPLDGSAPTDFATLAFSTGRGSPLTMWLPDGSLEYLAPETATTMGWYRVPPGGGRPVRLGAAPIQGAATFWSNSSDGLRVIVVKSEDRPDVYLIRNFADALRR